MEEDLLRSAELSNLLDRLYNTNLVVDGHDADNGGIGTHRGLELGHVDETVVSYWQVSDGEAFILQMSTAVKHTLVLCLCCDDVLLLAASPKKASDTLDTHVVTLSSPAGEDDLLWVCADEVGNVGAGVLYGFVGLPPIRVGSRMGVTIHAGHVGHHFVYYARVHGGCGLHV